MLRLECSIQSYAWGKDGVDSAVAKFKGLSEPSFDVDPKKPYAELWMGTHPSGPAKIFGTEEYLKDWLVKNPSAVGQIPEGYSAGDLPFLFKVLSIKTALSIQAHPDKVLAKELHAKFPNIYKDGNHKPEMAIALTPFEALCGFRKPQEIVTYLELYPELANLIGNEAVNSFKASLKSNNEDTIRSGYKSLFFGFMGATDALANAEISAFIRKLSSSESRNFLEDVILRLNKDYPDDRGIFCPLLLNYLTLAPGECFFMGPDEPHAYLSGDCVECMALSDNVVRAGLTPKLKDVDTLCNMLHYRNGEPALLRPISIDQHTSLYRPPAQDFPEFEVEKLSLTALEVLELAALPTASILLVTEAGNEATIFLPTDPSELYKELTTGTVMFVSAGVTVSLNSGHSSLVVFRAHINLGK